LWPLFREWIKRARQAGFKRFEFADAVEEIFREFRVHGEHVGEQHLALWTRLLREQNNMSPTSDD
jgi:hypothetical protein